MRWLASLAFLVVVTPAFAQEVKLAVTPLDGLGVDSALLLKLDATLARELRELKVERVDARDQPPCDGEAACLTALGRKLGASRVLAGSVGLAGDQLNIALKVVDVSSGTESRSIDEAAPIDQAELRLRAAATKLLAPDRYNKSGSIMVAFPLEGAEVVVDGSARGRTPIVGPIDGLSPGRRAVEVRYLDAKPWKGFVDLRFGEPHTVNLGLVEGALVEVASVAPVEPGAEPPLMLFGGIGVASLGVVAGVGAIIAYATTVSIHNDINNGQPSDEAFAAYAAAFNTCGTLTVISAVALAAGAGIIGFAVME